MVFQLQLHPNYSEMVHYSSQNSGRQDLKEMNTCIRGKKKKKALYHSSFNSAGTNAWTILIYATLGYIWFPKNLR